MKKKDPFFSIVTVSYNAETTIADTLASVFRQSFNSYEHIIVDGGSSDDTLNIIDQYAHSKLRVISEPDDGIYDAMNKGIQLSSGRVIIILNADDCLYDDNVLKLVFDCFEQTCADLVYSSIEFINKKKESVSVWRPHEFKHGDYSKGYHVPHPGFFATKKLYEILGSFDKSLRIAADFDLMLRFMECADVKSIKLDSTTVSMRADGESSGFKNILTGMSDIRRAFDNNNIKIVLPIYVFQRYFPKLIRKFKTSVIYK